MRTKTAPTIKLKDYSPPLFGVSEMHLHFILDPEHTRVRSMLLVVRNDGTPRDAPLQLDGDELKLVSLSLDGEPMDPGDYDATSQGLKIHKLPARKSFSVEIETELAPASNTRLMGLYQSNGVYCTQCEAEGFRRITYFPDRPDVLSVYTVRLEADRKTCPILLSNGNPLKKGRLARGRHYAIWHDPHPKPSYLFALVAGELDVYPDRYKTASGKRVKLNIYVEKGNADRAAYAMDALKRSMRWDEETYGREYDLDVFNIVAVSDFNMGAMENKGLNIFNDKYVLADPEFATDTDYQHIEAIIAHEYFHNWTGNRITCRDWFQLCLKEGLTVYRDQEFTADQRSRAVQRIQQVRQLKAGQFAEDAGPLAHSVRPEAYREINNFYTATVYQKGAELVRMLTTIVGPELYRKSTDLYFRKHDGRAAVVEDWLDAFERAAGIELGQFARWYGQAGTPRLQVREKFDRQAKTYVLELEQSIPPTPGQSRKQIVPIPVRFGFIGSAGDELTFPSSSTAVQNDLIMVDRRSVSARFEGVEEKPVVSLLRGFSAPVILEYREAETNRLIRAEHDRDLYNRWEALNSYASELLIKGARNSTPQQKPARQAYVSALVKTVFDDALEPAFRAQLLSLPGLPDLGREMGKRVDPDSLFKSRRSMQVAIGRALGADAKRMIGRLDRQIKATEGEIERAGFRALKNALLPMLVQARVPGVLKLVQTQFRKATNMTDRLAALNCLLQNQGDAKLAGAALEAFYKRHRNNHLVVDKWFSTQALIPGAKGLQRIKKLTRHPDFTLKNPNRARALLAPFAGANMTALHREDGSGYAFFANQILLLDAINPQVAARCMSLMNNWEVFENKRYRRARKMLQSIASRDGLSRDLQEIVDRMLS